jgi:hypothetical protein
MFPKEILLQKKTESTAILAGAALILSGVGLIPLVGIAQELGIEQGRWGSSQVFSSPEFDFFPTCDGSEFAQIEINVNKAFQAPFSASTGQQVDLGNNHIQVSFDGELANPWQLRLFNSSDQELRYSDEHEKWLTEEELEELYQEFLKTPPSPTPGDEGTDPTPGDEGTDPTPGDEGTDPTPGDEGTDPTPGETEVVEEPAVDPITELPASEDAIRGFPIFNELTPFAAEGMLFGVSFEGFFHIATVGDKTFSTYFSNNRPVAHEVTYRPDASFNECVEGRVVVDADQVLSFYEANPTPNTQFKDYVFSAPTGRSSLERSARTGATYKVLGNANLRFGYAGLSGDVSQMNSITATGDLSQPFYYNTTNRLWYPLTYSSYPLDMAIGSGIGSTHWTGGVVTELTNPLAGQVIDYSQWVQTRVSGQEAYGFGVITVTTRFIVNGQQLAVTHNYSLGQYASFLKVETTVKNESLSTAANVYIWVGTRDDNVAGNDGPIKYRGNLTQAGDFEEVSGATPIEQRTAPGSALLITTAPRDNSAGEGVLFYSTTRGTNVVVDGCCSFSKVYNQNPSVYETINDTRALSLASGFDGSYGLMLAPGNILAGSSTKITWFYAAGSTGDLADIARSVAAAAAPPAPSVSRTSQSATLTWTEPEDIEEGSVITGYRYRYSVDGGTNWIESVDLPATPLNATISGLDNLTPYVFQIRALTAPEEDLTPVTAGAWSASSVEEILGAPNAPPTPTVAGGDGTLRITYSPATVPAGLPAVTSYQYCLGDCNDENNWYPLSASPANLTALDNGLAFNVQIRATNSHGASLPSETVNAVNLPAWETTPTLPAELVRGDNVNSLNLGVSATAEVTYSISSGSLPTGLVLDAQTGSISGTPTAGGPYTFTITATNAAGAVSSTFTTTIDGPYWRPSTTAVSGNVGTSVFSTVTIASSGGGLDFTSAGGSIAVSGLPGGVSFTAFNVNSPGMQPSIAFTGAPLLVGTYEVTITVTDSNGLEIEQVVTFEIEAAEDGGGGDGGSSPAPETTASPTPRPSASPAPPATPSILNPSPSPSAGQGNGVAVLIPVVDPTPGVVYSDSNPIPEFIMNILSQPLAYILGVLSGDPELPALAPSESLAYENGEPVAIELVKTDAENGYILRGDGWQVALEATDSSGEPLLLDDSGNIILNKDRFVQFSGTGFAPGSVVKVWLFSDPTELSDVLADEAGNFVGQSAIPQAIPTGEHTIQLNGLTQDGQFRSVSLGVVIQPELVIAPAPPVGFDLTGLLNFLWLIAAGVLIWFFIVWRRRKKKEEEGEIPNNSGVEELPIFASEGFEPSQQFPNDSRRRIGAAAPPTRKRFTFKPKGA